MATLNNTRISDTYHGLIKTIDNAAISATLKQLSDGDGNGTGLSLNNAGDFKVNAILEFGSLKDTGENIIISKFVDAADGIGNNDNDTSIPTSAAIVSYVASVITAEDLDFTGDDAAVSGDVDLNSEKFRILGTANEIETSVVSAGGNQLKIGIPTNPVLTGIVTATTFSGDLNGTINTATTAVTQTAGNNSTKVATTAYVDTLDAASDLDFKGDSGTGDVTLNSQIFNINGTANEITTTASGNDLTISLPTSISVNLVGNVTGNLTGNVTGNIAGDLTGNVTATSVLANGVTATTQASSDSSTKVATTAFVKGLDNASDLDITDGTTTGDINLNTQSLSILGTANQVVSTVLNQGVTLSLPSSINVNSASATILQSARDISLTGEASATISGFNGSASVSGAVTLDNDSVTEKVLTGLSSPTATNILASDSILQAFGKTQSQLNTLAGGLRFMGTWNATTNTPTLASGGGEATSGTTSGTTANKLVDSSASFTSTVTTGDQVVNQESGATALVTNIDSNTVITIDADIMVSGQTYTIDNSPFLQQGHYFVVSVGGTSSLNGLSNWAVGDWVIAGSTNVWEKLDHTQVDGTGTVGNITKWSSTNIIADSIMAETGSGASALVTASGSIAATQLLSSGGNFAVNTNKFTANATSGNVAFPGDLAINTNKFTVDGSSGNVVVAGSGTFGGDVLIGKNDSTATRQLTIGEGRTGNGFSFIDLIGDATYTDYGLRMLRGNGGANSLSILEHRGTGNFEIKTAEAAAIVFETTGTERMRIWSAGMVQIGSDDSVTPEILTVQAYSHNQAFSGKSSAANYLWFLRNENNSGRFQLFNTSSNATIEFKGADGAATFTGTVGIGTTGIYSTDRDLNLSGKGLSIKNNVNGSNNNWSYIQNTDTGSASNLVFQTGNATALTLANTGPATFAGSVQISGGQVRLIANQLQSGFNSDVENADFWINYQGYQGGTTRYRDFRVGDGKQNQIAFFDGSSGETTFSGSVCVAGIPIAEKFNTPNIKISGSTITGTSSANTLFIDNLSSTSRFFSCGANSSTNGTFNFNTGTSAALGATMLTLASTGATFAGNVTTGGTIFVNNVGSDKKIGFRRTGANNFSIEHDVSSLYFYNESTSTSCFKIANNSNATFAGNITVGAGQASTNREINLNGVVNKAIRIQFQESGTNRWLLGQGAASENSNFELYNSAGSITMSANRTTNAVTFSNKISATGGSFIGAAASGAPLVTIENNSGSTATSYGLLVKGGGNSASGKTFEVKDDSGNTDLIVKGNGNIAIGGLAATAKLQINATPNAGSGSIAAFLVNSSITVGTEVRLAFAANTNDDIASNRYSYISTINTGGSNGQDMLFATNSTGNPAAERVRITTEGIIKNTQPSGYSIQESTLSYSAAANATTNVSLDLNSIFGLTGGGMVMLEVSLTGYGNAGSNGIIFKWIGGGFSSHTPASFHQTEVIANSTSTNCSGAIYYPSAQVAGVTVVNGTSEGIVGVMNIKITTNTV